MEEADTQTHTNAHKAKEVIEKKMRKKWEGEKTLELRKREQVFEQAKLCDMLKGSEKERNVGVLRLLMQHMAYT